MDTLIITGVAVVALLVSLIADRGKTFRALRIAGRRFVGLLPSFLTMLAAVSLVLALVPQQTIARYLGGENTWLATLAGALAVAIVGGLYVSFPIAAALRHKGARLGLVLSYIGLAGVCRIPMTLFEISFLGVPFTVIRYLVSLPLVILVSELLGNALARRGFEMASPQD